MNDDRENLLLSVIALPQKLASIKIHSDKFSVFNVFDITDMEIRHSNVLAWLLDPYGDHGLGECFLRAFLEKCLGNALAYNLGSFLVDREYDNIDILLVSPVDKIVVAIENKIWAKEGVRETIKNGRIKRSQLDDYEATVERQFPNQEFEQYYVYLTPTGDLPKGGKGKWHPCGYKSIVGMLQQIAECRNDLHPYTLAFIHDYLGTLRKEILMQYTKEEQDACLAVYSENKKAIQFLNECVSNVFKQRFEALFARLSKDHSEGVSCFNVCDNGFVHFRFAKVDENVRLERTKKLPCDPYAVQLEPHPTKNAVCCNLLVYETPKKWKAFPWHVPDASARVNRKNWCQFDLTGKFGGQTIEQAAGKAIDEIKEWLAKPENLSRVFNVSRRAED